MKIPYNRLLIQGNTLFAARGGKIHSFSLVDGSHISTWQHPDVEKVASAIQANLEAENEEAAPGDADVNVDTEKNEPPAKRQKLQEGEGEDGTTNNADAPAPEQDEPSATNNDEGKRKGKGKKSKKKNGEQSGQTASSRQFARVPDRPVIAQIAATADGQHLVVVSGHDKGLWVFAHDGKGTLTQLSKRVMPKRPSSILIGPDDQIISADKFGDVYSLPLLFDEISSAERSSKFQPDAAKTSYKPAATTLTVHSKRNLEALENQKRMMDPAARAKLGAKKREDPEYELTLQLGHVSMLTALLLGESEGHRYLLTSDRDEHIRVSRGIPQAHIIESYCLGHKEFVGDITIPAGRGDVLVSGGGDEELFLWDWKAGSLLSKAKMLTVAQEIAPEITKVAVSGLYSLLYPGDAGSLTYVLAICEDIKAIFTWKLNEDNVLTYPGIIQLPGKPLHLAISFVEGTPPTVIAAIDPEESTEAKSLHRFLLTASDGRLAVETESRIQDEPLESDEPDIAPSVVRSLLYGVESLRKQPIGETDLAAADEEEEAGGDDVAMEE